MRNIMIKTSVVVKADKGLDGRPIALLVQEASQYDSQVYIEIENKKINAKSLIGMMSLKLKKGLNIIVVSNGSDEEAAASGVEKFLAAQS